MNTWLMKGYFDTVPREIDEAARIDGAGHLRIFASVVLPLVKPMLAVQALWAFMGPFGDYLLAKFLLRSPESLTIAVGLQTFISNPQQQKSRAVCSGRDSCGSADLHLVLLSPKELCVRFDIRRNEGINR